MPPPPTILTINAGSSSIRFACYEIQSDSLNCWGQGKLDRVGSGQETLQFEVLRSGAVQNLTLDGESLLDWIEKEIGFDAIVAVGHRVVHGMHHTQPERVTPELLEELRQISPFDPEHLPREIEWIEAFARRMPQLLQIVCFDTAFHRGMPRVARLLPIPQRFEAQGVERYGFHGLSYQSLLESLTNIAGRQAARGRVVLAHLGNGASMAALREGRSVDTSMGFTPAGGLVMGTRAGDLDPGVAAYILRTERMSAEDFNRMVHHESGLLGVSGSSSDMRDLLERQAQDERAAEAVELFCYQARKWLGAFATVLGGIDTVVFAGGIGENAPEIRKRICAGLEFLGISIDSARNQSNSCVISKEDSPACVRVIRTNEESVLARAAFAIVEKSKEKTNE
ncbi:acetate/propionate family kinase [Bryobacter aggregatus]|uniref:acetate/propionate family kinase n=1 Tax=Bryobacter aggregatus TaxID=360054 RepID=UPI0004E1C0CF|nr:acetate/propionate family kinase [Bryobacter aggregatus]